MAVFKNGIFAYDNGKPVTPQSLGISLSGIQTCRQFFSSGSITNNTQQYAVYALVSDLERYNIWDKMRAIYPMVGQAGVSSSFQLNLKDPNTFRGTFYGGWSFSTTGATPNNSTSAYMNTNMNASESLQRASVHMSFYSRTQDTSLNAVDMGCYQPGTGEIVLTHYYNSNAEKIFNAYLYPSEAARSATSNTLGLAIGTRTAVNNAKLYFGNSLLNTNTSTISNNMPSASIAIGSSFRSDTLGPQQNSNRECAFASIGDGLTDTEAANLYTAVQRFQTTLGRQV